jgi:hypothetical protein
VLIEELFFLLVAKPMLIEEPLEGRVSVFEAVLTAQEFIIVGPFVAV